MEQVFSPTLQQQAKLQTANGNASDAKAPANHAHELYQLSVQMFNDLRAANQMLVAQLAQPLKALLESKRLRIIAECPVIGKDMVVQFRSGGEYATTDNNVIKLALKPLLERHSISYHCHPISHTVSAQGSSHLYKVMLQFSVTDAETGYTEVVPGEWVGLWLGSLDKGYASAITNGIGKFLINYFSISSLDRPEEYSTDADGNMVVHREKTAKKTARTDAPQQQQAATQQPTRAELDYQKVKAVLGVIASAHEVKAKYEAIKKDKNYDQAAAKRAYVERYYQLVDLDLSEETQLRFITENWNGTIYKPTGKINHSRIYCMNAEIAVRLPETVDNLKQLAQFKIEK